MGRVDAARRRAEAAGSGENEKAHVGTVGSGAVERPLAAPEPVRGEVKIEDLDATVARKIVVDRKISQAAREQYRRLAASLHHSQATTGIKVVMISSAVPEEGKTLTAVNIALTLSESYHRRVLLVDADFRRPTLHTVLNVEGFPGLTENLMAVEDRKLRVHRISPNLSILPAGKTGPDPMSGLASPRLRYILDEARELFDWVIVDTPPVGVLPDASLVSASVDGIVFVVKAGSTPYDLVKRGIEAIGTERLLGVVLNRAVINAHRYGYGYHHYSSYQDPTLQEP